MITAGLIDEFLDGAKERITDAIASAFNSVTAPLFGWMTDPLIHWYVYLALFFVACSVVGWFFGFKWVRAGLGFLIIVASAFVAGGWKMRQIDIERAREAQKKKRK